MSAPAKLKVTSAGSCPAGAAVGTVEAAPAAPRTTIGFAGCSSPFWGSAPSARSARCCVSGGSDWMRAVGSAVGGGFGGCGDVQDKSASVKKTTPRQQLNDAPDRGSGNMRTMSKPPTLAGHKQFLRPTMHSRRKGCQRRAHYCRSAVRTSRDPALSDRLPMLILTFLAILSGAGLALAWFLVAPPIVAQIAASRVGHALRSRGAMALLLILPFAAVAAALVAQGDRLRPSLASAPSAPPVPLDQARKEAPHDLDAAVKQLEARLAKEPNDQDGWRLLSRSYTELGETAKAEDAARHAAALGAKGGDAETQSARGEDLVTAAGGRVTPDARAAFTAALAADPQDPRARFFMGLAAAQDGNADEAVQRWLELERDSPPDAPWLQGLRANLDRLAQQAGIATDDLAKRRSALAAASPMPAPPLPSRAGGGCRARPDRFRRGRGGADGARRSPGDDPQHGPAPRRSDGTESQGCRWLAAARPRLWRPGRAAEIARRLSPRERGRSDARRRAPSL